MTRWCGWGESNPRPLASEANTLSTELQPHASQHIAANFDRQIMARVNQLAEAECQEPAAPGLGGANPSPNK